MTDDIERLEKVREIPALSVRSSLEKLESSASQVVHRLESVKTVLEEEARENEVVQPSNPFLPEKRLPSEILSALETLVSQPVDGESDELAEYPLPPIDEVSHLVLVSHSVTSYLSYLNRRQLLKVTSKILTDTNRWLSNLFRFIDCTASYHSDSSDCLVRALRLALVAKFPGYFENGVRNLPEIGLYISDNASHIGLQFACRQVGLPINSIRLIASTSVEPSGTKTMDVSALQNAIGIDVNAGRVPLFVIADLGASLLGEVDNVVRLQELCRANHIWLHARGNCLASMILMQGAAEATQIADSITLNLNNWFGVPGVQTVLLYRPIANVAPAVLFDADPLISRYLSAISVWMMLQAIGKETIIERILMAFQSIRAFYDIVSNVDGLVVLSKHPGSVSLVDLINKPINPMVLFESAVSVVVFKFNGKYKEQSQQQGAITDNADTKPSQTDAENKPNGETGEESTVAPSTNVEEKPEVSSLYFDRLNSWLGQILQRDSSQIDLEIIENATHGTCIRFCPLELGIGELPPNEEYLDNFAQCIDAQVEILRATLKHKKTFNRLVRENTVLQLIELEDWAGLGGVRYVPEHFDLEAETAKSDLNKLNNALVEHLRATDSAFSLGEDADGLTCVRFGMVTEDTDVNELLELVIDAGKAIQEDSKALVSMSEIVKKGIEAATLELQRENEEKLWQEGILRHVPVVGTFVNWFSPPPKEAGIKGRSLNLQQGVVESTENIYKYHMQLPANGNQHIPVAQSQTPVSGHSRSESQSSTVSANKQNHPDATNANQISKSTEAIPEKIPEVAADSNNVEPVVEVKSVQETPQAAAVDEVVQPKVNGDDQSKLNVEAAA